MALLQPKLSLKVAQRQILTPGLMQMVSVLALNKLEVSPWDRWRLATKDELMADVWPDSVVEENNLQVQISTQDIRR